MRNDEVFKYLTGNGWIHDGGARWRRPGELTYRSEDDALAAQHAAMREQCARATKEAAHLQAENEALHADLERLRAQVFPLLKIECELRAIDVAEGVATLARYLFARQRRDAHRGEHPAHP
jgi:hypothetical protein